MAATTITWAFWDIGFYVVGMVAMMLIYLPFSPMTIDLVNFSRDTQIAIYRHRRKLWVIAGVCLGVILLRGLTGMLGSSGVLDTSRLPAGLATPHVVWFWTTLVSIGVLALLFWSGYVPYVMSPPSRQQILSVAQSEQTLRPDDIVLGLVYGNEARAYPRDTIARPHYFTDTIGGTPLIVSYCILCNSGIAFESELDGRALDLKCVTAYNNNIIYYEPATGNFIQQLDGKVVYGPDVGKALVAHPVVLSTWGAWKHLHPQTTLYHAPAVTLRDKMVAMMLQLMIPIAKLSRRSTPWHRVRGTLDKRQPAMSYVVGVEINADSCAYPVDALHRNPVLCDTVGGESIAVFYDAEHDVAGVFSRNLDATQALTFTAASRSATAAVARDRETGTLWNVAGKGLEGPLAGRTLATVPHFNKLFWFSWALFKPATRVNAATA